MRIGGVGVNVLLLVLLLCVLVLIITTHQYQHQQLIGSRGSDGGSGGGSRSLLRSQFDDDQPNSVEGDATPISYGTFVLQDRLKIGETSNVNEMRWKVVKAYLYNDRKGVLSSEPFMVLDYASRYGALGVSIASTFPLATVLSIDKGVISKSRMHTLPYQARVAGKIGFHTQVVETLGLNSNVVCAAKVDLASFASVRMARLVVDYQLLLGFVEHLNIHSVEALGGVLDTLAHIATTTIIQLPPKDHEQYPLWFAHGRPKETVSRLLSHAQHIDVASLGNGDEYVVLDNTYEEEGYALSVGRKMCERFWTLFRCTNNLLPEWCPTHTTDVKLVRAEKIAVDTRQRSSDESSDTKQHEQLDADAVVHGKEHENTPLKSNNKPVEREKAKEVKKIPRSVCGDRKGLVVAKVKGCGKVRADKASWVYENDGWYKCRNATHWLTGCKRIKS
eukprot:m.55882 g.55882  ORF g.55882 m.55882 type:complete len:447 (-) comp11155_c0_seq1:68-1408(-)